MCPFTAAGERRMVLLEAEYAEEPKRVLERLERHQHILVVGWRSDFYDAFTRELPRRIVRFYSQSESCRINHWYLFGGTIGAVLFGRALGHSTFRNIKAMIECGNRRAIQKVYVYPVAIDSKEISELLKVYCKSHPSQQT